MNNISRGCRADCLAVAALALFFICMVGLTWGHLGDIEIDSGRETMVPLRLLHGDRLYTDIQWLFGPLSPYLNSFLFGCFGPRLEVEYAHGLVAALTFGLLVYGCCRHWLNSVQAALAVLFYWIAAAFTPNDVGSNWIFPYSFNVIDALVLDAIALLSILRASASSNMMWPILAGGCSVLAVLTKIDAGAPCLAAVILWTLLPQQTPPMSRWRRTALCALGAGGVALTIQLLFLSQLSFKGWLMAVWPDASSHWSALWGKSWTYHVMGFNRPWVLTKNLTAALTTVAVFLCFLGLFCWRLPMRIAAGALIVIAVTVGAWWTQWPFYEVVFQGTLFVGGAAFPLGLMLLTALYRGFRFGWSRRRVQAVSGLVLATGLLCRVIAVTGWGDYSNFFAAFTWFAAAIFFLRLLPDWMGARFGRLQMMRKTAMLVLLVLCIVGLRFTTAALQNRTGCVTSARGRICTTPERATLMQEMLEFFQHNTSPSDTLTVLPRCTLLPFLANRPVVTPWFDLSFAVKPSPEMDECVRQSLENAQPAFIVVFDSGCDPLTYKSLFGRDCYSQAYRWMRDNYRLVKSVGVKRENCEMIAHGADIFQRVAGQRETSAAK